jgi:hypothetical protein
MACPIIGKWIFTYYGRADPEKWLEIKEVDGSPELEGSEAMISCGPVSQVVSGKRWEFPVKQDMEHTGKVTFELKRGGNEATVTFSWDPRGEEDGEDVHGPFTYQRDGPSP